MSYRKGVHQAIHNAIVAAMATGQSLDFVAQNSFFDVVYPDFSEMPDEAFPAMLLVPDIGGSKFFTTGNPPAENDMLRFRAVLLQRHGQDGFHAFFGDPANGVTGLYDFEAAFKNVVETDQTLGGAVGVQKVICKTDNYKYEFYPTIYVDMIIEVTGEITTRTH